MNNQQIFDFIMDRYTKVIVISRDIRHITFLLTKKDLTLMEFEQLIVFMQRYASNYSTSAFEDGLFLASFDRNRLQYVDFSHTIFNSTYPNRTFQKMQEELRAKNIKLCEELSDVTRRNTVDRLVQVHQDKAMEAENNPIVIYANTTGVNKNAPILL